MITVTEVTIDHVRRQTFAVERSLHVEVGQRVYDIFGLV